MGKLNVCMVVNNLEVGGLEKVVLSLSERLGEHGFDVSLVCLDGAGRLFSELRLPRDRCLVLEKRLVRILPGLRADPGSILRVRRFLRERRIDVVHAHNRAPLIVGAIAAHLLWPRPIVVYSEHNQINRARGLDRRKFGYYAQLADEIIAVSHDLRRILVDDIEVRADVRVIHNGIDGARLAARRRDPEVRARVRAELGVGAREFVIGCAVVLSEQKGIAHLLEAAPKVLRRAPGVRFVVAGDGPLREGLMRRAADEGLGNAVLFPGYRADVPDLIAAFDAYVLPSLWEGLPLALIEAIAMGKPIVASRVGGVPEIVEHGVDGLLVPPRDADALADALTRVVVDRALLASARERGPIRFARQFSVEAMVEEHARFFEEVAAKRGRGAPAGARRRAEAPAPRTGPSGDAAIDA